VNDQVRINVLRNVLLLDVLGTNISKKISLAARNIFHQTSLWIAGLTLNSALMDAEKCRRFAERYLVRAQQMTSPAARAMLIDLAAQWMGLTEEAEQGKPITQQQEQVQPKKDEE